MVSGVRVGEPLTDGRWDPLAGVRGLGVPDLDVLMTGSVFLDLVFTGLAEVPTPGTEIWADGMGSSPGGICNLAVAASRLGLRTGLAAGFGADVYGDWCWDVLSRQEHVDLSLSRQFADTHSAVTVSVAHSGDRSMITHGHPVSMTADELIGRPPASAAAIAELTLMLDGGAGEPWWLQAAAQGTKVFADVGWDPTGIWDTATLEALASCHAFMPNQVEAMAYTRTDSPQDALHALADRVPLAVVTCGADGALAIDASTGEQAHVPVLPVVAIDPTGAGDVFGAALVLGTVAGWSLADRLAFSALCSALAVQQFGGSLSAPGWGDISDWWKATSGPNGIAEADVVQRYRFLDQLVPRCPVQVVRRAHATIAAQSDLAQFSPATATIG